MKSNARNYLIHRNLQLQNDVIIHVITTERITVERITKSMKDIKFHQKALLQRIQCTAIICFQTSKDASNCTNRLVICNLQHFVTCAAQAVLHRNVYFLLSCNFPLTSMLCRLHVTDVNKVLGIICVDLIVSYCDIIKPNDGGR